MAGSGANALKFINDLHDKVKPSFLKDMEAVDALAGAGVHLVRHGAGGAKIAVYHAVAIEGEYVKNGEAIEINRSGPEGFTIKKKLSAGHVYIMEELEAPAGIHLSPPVIFTVNQAGTGISNIRNNFSVLECSSASGTIESLTVFGRAADKIGRAHV